MNQKNCTIPIAGQPLVDDKPVATATTDVTVAASKDVKLSELKRLYEGNLITKEVYAERQKMILASPAN